MSLISTEKAFFDLAWMPVYTSNGTPEGVVSAPRGGLCINVAVGATQITMLYMRVTGAGNIKTGWVAFNNP